MYLCASSADALTTDSQEAPLARGVKVKKAHVSKADIIRQQIASAKQTDQDVSNETWWKDHLAAFDSLSTKEKISHSERLFSNRRAGSGWLAVELRVYRLHLEFQRWIEESGADNADSGEQVTLRDRYSVSITRMIKALFDAGGLFPAAVSILELGLRILGLEGYVASLRTSSPNPSPDNRELSFKFVKIVRSKTQTARYKFMRITEDPVSWQMRLFGEYMDRSMDSEEDARVSFMPDAWQRKVLDCLDLNHSLLVVGEYMVSA